MSISVENLIFGGSFDPPHLGHLNIIKYVLVNHICNKIIIVPAAISPFKTHSPPVAAKHRIRMLELLVEILPIQFHACVKIDDFEITKPPPSYSVETIEHLKLKNNNQETGLLLGSDSALDLTLWHRSTDIIQNFTIVIFMRSRDTQNIRNTLTEFTRTKHINFKVQPLLLDNPLNSCSSTGIRKLVQQSQQLNLSNNPAVSSCLHKKIVEYIQINKLYSDECNINAMND